MEEVMITVVVPRKPGLRHIVQLSVRPEAKDQDIFEVLCRDQLLDTLETYVFVRPDRKLEEGDVIQFCRLDPVLAAGRRHISLEIVKPTVTLSPADRWLAKELAKGRSGG